MSESPVDPTIDPDDAIDPSSEPDGSPSNPDKTGESIDNGTGPADDPEGEHEHLDPTDQVP